MEVLRKLIEQTEIHEIFGGLCAMIGGTLALSEPNLLAQWFDDTIAQLNSNNEVSPGAILIQLLQG